ncbi:MAG: hypothetical protein ACLPID_05975 [Beijerinckiaceae bacterium]
MHALTAVAVVSYLRKPLGWLAFGFLIQGLAFWPNHAAYAQTDLLQKLTPRVRDALSHLQERPGLYAAGMTEADLGGNTAQGSVRNHDILFGQALALAHEDRMEISPYLILRALKEATWKPYPRVNAAVAAWVAFAHSVLIASKAEDFANADANKAIAGKLFHEAITGVEITDHPDGPVYKTTQLGQFITATEEEIESVEKARAEQGLVPLSPMPQMAIARATKDTSLPTHAWTDPHDYCRAVGTIDQPDSKYVGPKEPVEMRRLFFDESYGSIGSVEWRCMDGSVYACGTANSPICSKMSPNDNLEAIKAFCQENPNQEVIAAAITGRFPANWVCKGGKARIKDADFRIDKRGYPVDYWKWIPSGAMTFK